MKKTKIITTLWPSTDTAEKIEALYNAWANVVRFNYSHSNYQYFEKIIDIVKRLNEEKKTNLAILTDTKWPEIRTKAIEEKIILEENEVFLLTTLEKEKQIKNSDKKIIVSDYKYTISDLEKGRIIDIDTWLLKAEIIDKSETFLTCKALNKHSIGSKRHINLPWIKIKLPGITENDKKDIEFAVSKWTDFIALSFVRNKENILDLKNYLKEIKAPENIQIISKIENYEALENLWEIIEESDGIMIARWDLWAEIPYETLPSVQENIANKCKIEWKFFIVATQMLETMIENPIPTRAETTDIFNAAMQQADCTMLSWETAMWKYPVETVKVMSKILEFSEQQINYSHNKYFLKNLWEKEFRKQLIKNAVYTAKQVWAKNIILFTTSWFTAKIISAFKPELHTFAFTYSDFVRKKLTILFWLKTFQIEKKSSDENIENAIKELKNKNLIKNWEKILAINWIEKMWQIVPSIQVIEIK